MGYGYDPDADEPSGHCAGTSARKCGRFVGSRGWHCARCEDELREAWRGERDEETAYIARLEATEAAWRVIDFDVTMPGGFDGPDMDF